VPIKLAHACTTGVKSGLVAVDCSLKDGWAGAVKAGVAGGGLFAIPGGGVVDEEGLAAATWAGAGGGADGLG
jgi:hypothetical protein